MFQNYCAGFWSLPREKIKPPGRLKGKFGRRRPAQPSGPAPTRSSHLPGPPHIEGQQLPFGRPVQLADQLNGPIAEHGAVDPVPRPRQLPAFTPNGRSAHGYDPRIL